MMRRWLRVGGALSLALSGAAGRARRQLYGGQFGLRILTLHDTPPHNFDRLRRLVEWTRENLDVVGPETAAELSAGQYNPPARDQLLFTFDDGFASNYAAAKYLAEQNVRAIFFIVPSFVDRTMEQFLEFHRGQATEAFRFTSSGTLHGLSRTQAREMSAMGHVIAAHNYAHRNLGELTTPHDLEYEIDRAVDAVTELTGRPCQDFAIGFGRPWHVSSNALAHLRRRCDRVYSCVRGLNVPGRSPRLILRDSINLDDSLLFHRLCLHGAADLKWAPEVEQLRNMDSVLPTGNHAAT